MNDRSPVPHRDVDARGVHPPPVEVRPDGAVGRPRSAFATSVERVVDGVAWHATGEGEPRFRGTAALALEAWVRSGAGPADVRLPGIEAVEWLASAPGRPGLQVRLCADPARDRVRLTWLVQADGRTEREAGERAARHAADLRAVLEGCRHLRLRPVGAPDDLEAARGSGRPEGGYAAAVLPSAVVLPGGPALRLPARRAPDPARASDVVRLLLAREEPGALTVSLRACDRPGAAEAACRALSRDRARLAGLAQGVHFVKGDGREGHRVFPAELSSIEAAARSLAEAEAWLSGMGPAPLEVRVAVLGAGPSPTALLQAVGRSHVGASARWCALTADQAAAIASGPLDALACPVPGDLDDAESRPSRSTVPLCDWVPGPVAAAAAELPLPEAAGLPGIPVEAGRLRPLPRGMALPDRGALLGTAHGLAGAVPLRLAPDDLARHLYVVGKTGTGKSTLLRSLAVSLAREGEGVGVIDPHGDLADAVARDVGASRPVVVFDPSRPDCPGLDPLRHDGSLASMERVLEEVTAIMFRLYPAEYMGPMFDRYSRALLLPLLAARESLASISRLPHDPDFRRACLSRLSAGDPLHDEVARFWTREYPDWGDETRGDMQTYTLSKYDALLRSSMLRRAFDPKREQLAVDAIADSGGVLVARLPQGVIGPVSAWFLGMSLMARLQAAVFARAAIPASQRRPFTLVLDEFHHFVGASGYGYATGERTLGPLLSEARKFGLRLVLAHQFADQLDDTTRASLLGNVGSIACFRTGRRDADLLAPELGAGVTPDELHQLPLYTAVTRLLTHGTPAPPLTLTTVR